MLNRWTWLAMLMVALLAFAGCSSDDDDPVIPTPQDTAFEVLAEAGAAYVNSDDCPGVISATALAADLDGYTVIDIRSEATYLAGHIPGAYLSSLATIVDDILTFPQDKPFVVTCYSGQSAGHAKIALELLGYDIQSLGYGMCSWNQLTNSGWVTGHGDFMVGDVETTNNNAALTTEHTWPVLEDLGYEAGTVVVNRVRDTLTAGFKSIKYLNNTSPALQLAGHEDEYFIINYWDEGDYDGTSGRTPGHIPGAYQFTPKASLGMDQMLKYVPTDMPVVVYCWTGQTSSQITFYLNMLGYEAYSLSYGANGLFYSDLTAGNWKWVEGTPTVSQTMEETPTALPAYADLFDAMDAYLNAGSWYIAASALQTLVDDDAVTVIDVRSATDWAAGHIHGAINVPDYENIDTYLGNGTIPTDKDFAVVCATGQNSGWVSAYLNLMGYTSKSLSYGMAGWTFSLVGPWNSGIGNTLASAETTHNNGDLTWHMFPAMDDYTVAGRANAVLDEKLMGVKWTDISGAPEEWVIVNYWSEADYDGTGTSGAPGHIPGAFQFTPGTSLTLESMLANLPPETTDQILVYCWTGQTSAQVTMMLRMLGYNAYSLKFGANSLFHDDLTAHVWNGNLSERPLYDSNGDLVDQGMPLN